MRSYFAKLLICFWAGPGAHSRGLSARFVVSSYVGLYCRISRHVYASLCPLRSSSCTLYQLDITNCVQTR